jgi:membrane-bound inhibitor of C-type lysozyme
MRTCSLAGLTLLALTLPVAAQQRFYRYECEAGKTFEASYGAEQVQLTLDGRTPISLPQVVAASGARYSNGTITLFTKGNDAFIEEGGNRTHSDCVGQMASADSPTQSSSEPVRGLW